MLAHEIVTAEREHICEISQDIRREDEQECWAAVGRPPFEVIEISFDVSEVAWTGIYGGKPVCIFGIAPLNPLLGIGQPWMMGTRHLEDCQFIFLKRSRYEVIPQMLERYPYLENHVDARNRVAIRWLSWLGFRIFPAIPFGVLGMPFHPFRMARPC